jgi:hypothetical protein
MHSNLWLIAPLMSIVSGVILIAQGLRRRAQHDSVATSELSQAAIFRVRAVLFSSGLFLTTIAALLLLGLMKR